MWKKTYFLLRIITINLLFFIVLFVLFLEVPLRKKYNAWPFQQFHHKATSNPLLARLEEGEKELLWRNAPGTFCHDGLLINSLGLRNREIFYKPYDVYRILFLGDSLFVLSTTLNGKSYIENIERILSKQLNKKIETINAGICGYTTYQELQFLKFHGLKWEVDAVVIGFVLNDVYHKYLHIPPLQGNAFSWDPNILLNRFNNKTFPGILFSWSYYINEIVDRIQTLERKNRNKINYQFEQNLDLYLAWKEYGWVDVRKSLLEIKSILKSRNIPLVVIIFPVIYQFDDHYLNSNKDYVLYPQSRITKILEDIDVKYLDLTDFISKHGKGSLYKDYIHLNEKGNELIQSEILTFIKNNLFNLNLQADITSKKIRYNKILPDVNK